VNVVVTGGAGFIGSHLVDALLARGDDVTVLDDLSTGKPENLAGGARLVTGSVTDDDAVRDAVTGAELVFHQAARGSVPRSIADPIATDTVNSGGTMRVLLAARDAGVRRVVLASSSSVYGGADELPTPETAPVVPRSPYAVSKLSAEHHARVFSELYDVETVALRYFNVFGPRQRPDSQYAAVIPLFVDALLAGRTPVVFGDGLQSRDFTYVDNVVHANLAAADGDAKAVSGRAFNIAFGDTHTILDLLDAIAGELGVEAAPAFEPPRAGDVRASWADVSLAREAFGFDPTVPFAEGIARTVDWFRSRL
jgi:UDP-glucose 4-epimerase